jgi:hypothetical protein
MEVKPGTSLELPVHEMRLQVHHMVGTAMDPLVPTKEPKEPITVTPDRIIYQSPSYRLRNRGIDTLPSVRAGIDEPET